MTILPNGADTVQDMPPIVDAGLNYNYWFKDVDAGSGSPGTILNAAFLNKLLLLLRTTFTAAGVVDETAKATTLVDAIEALIGESTNDLALQFLQTNATVMQNMADIMNQETRLLALEAI